MYKNATDFWKYTITDNLVFYHIYLIVFIITDIEEP